MRSLSELTIQQANRLGISFPTQLPLFRAEPNHQHLAEWVTIQPTPMTRQIAQKIADNLEYITFENFLSQLQKTVQDFHQKSNGAPYVLLLGESRQDKLERGCSDQWVIGLALEHCGLREPVGILTPDELTAWRANNPDITHVLMLDDASYSGTQKTTVLKSLEKDSQLSVYLGLPFMTRYAENALLEEESNFKELIFLNHTYMQSTWDILNSEERHFAKAAGIGYISPRQTITYFDHRYADFYSCFQQVYTGRDLLDGAYVPDIMDLLGHRTDEMQVEEYNQIVFDVVEPNYNQDCSGYLIPLIIPPYQLHLAKDKDALHEAILKGKVGNRSPYPLIDQRIIEELPTTSVSQKIPQVSYNSPKIPMAIQLAFDQKYASQTELALSPIEYSQPQGSPAPTELALPPTPDSAALNMRILGVCIAVLGIAAVALAFTVLGAATLGIAGIVVGTLGAAMLVTGVGLFSKSFIPDTGKSMGLVIAYS